MSDHSSPKKSAPPLDLRRPAHNPSPHPHPDPSSSSRHRALGQQLGMLHTSQHHAPLHKGRFGFAVSNFLALTPLNNTWDPSWPAFFSRRLEAQVTGLYKVGAWWLGSAETGWG